MAKFRIHTRITPRDGGVSVVITALPVPAGTYDRPDTLTGEAKDRDGARAEKERLVATMRDRIARRGDEVVDETSE
jgi:hypothetical protein